MINSFSGQYRFLSNFYLCAVEYKGTIYPSSEHAYQAAKTDNVDSKYHILHAKTPGEAKRLGKVVPLVVDWELKKLIVMKEILQAKFYQSDFRRLLIGTFPHELVEGNTWGDTYWGVCNGKGSNTLGQLLMIIRDELMSEE